MIHLLNELENARRNKREADANLLNARHHLNNEVVKQIREGSLPPTVITVNERALKNYLQNKRRRD